MRSFLPFPFAPFFLHLFRSCSNRVEATFRRLICPHPDRLLSLFFALSQSDRKEAGSAWATLRSAERP